MLLGRQGSAATWPKRICPLGGWMREPSTPAARSVLVRLLGRRLRCSDCAALKGTRRRTNVQPSVTIPRRLVHEMRIVGLFLRSALAWESQFAETSSRPASP
jgi:hypothetical protein